LNPPSQYSLPDVRKSCEKIYTNYCDKQDFTMRDGFRFEEGTRYVKVIRGTGVHCFVDKRNGDILKAASWKTPAKHARGNIFDSKNGLGWMGEYGPAYLR
jgi:hypothetical protein